MGLDNGFMICKRSTPDVCIQLAWFRKYMELDDWVRRNCEAVKHEGETETEDSGEYHITASDLQKLRNEIEDIAIDLMKCYRKIRYYDANGYPQRFFVTYYDRDFNPAESASAFAGEKLMRLYRTVLQMQEMIELFEVSEAIHGPNNDYYITCYSSW